jgi:hypothetical protein
LPARCRPFILLCLHGAPLAQLDRATDYESVGRAFESPGAHHPANDMASAPTAPWTCVWPLVAMAGIEDI